LEYIREGDFKNGITGKVFVSVLRALFNIRILGKRIVLCKEVYSLC